MSGSAVLGLDIGDVVRDRTVIEQHGLARRAAQHAPREGEPGGGLDRQHPRRDVGAEQQARVPRVGVVERVGALDLARDVPRMARLFGLELFPVEGYRFEAQ